MDKSGIINKPVDLGQLDAEFRAKSSKVTGLSLNDGTQLTVYGADDLTDADITNAVSVHVPVPHISNKQKLKNDIDASPLTPETKVILKRIIDLR